MSNLNVSGAKCYLQCARKYQHQNVLQTQADSDYSPSVALRLGSAFHKCLEEFGYSYKKMSTSSVIEICSRFGIKDAESAQVLACLRGYFAAFPTTEVLAMELLIETDTFRGTIDLVQKLANGWVIVDNKTTSQVDPTSAIRLQSDWQMCMYAAHYHVVAHLLGLDVNEFLGISHRIVEKPSERMTKKENWVDYSARCKTYSTNVFVPFEKLQIGDVWAQFFALKSRIDNDKMWLQTRGFGCFDSARGEPAFWNPCPYYSQCYGAPFKKLLAEGDNIIPF